LIIQSISILHIIKNDKNSGKSSQSKSNLLKGYSHERKIELYNEFVRKKDDFEKKKKELDTIFNKSLYDKTLINVQSQFYDLESSLRLDKLHLLEKSSQVSSNDFSKYSK
jgi:hypothetical protein